MYQLDEIDRDILFELDHNSRLPITDLATKLNLGRERINYRIRRLIDRGVIRRFTTSVNPYQFGLVIHKTFVRVENDKKRIGKFIDHLNKHPRVYWHAECDGTWDVMFAISSKNPKEFHGIQGQILSKFSDIIIGFAVYTIVDAWFFRKSYLRGYGTDCFLFGGEPGDHTLTELDFKLLKNLAQNSRLTAVELADNVGATPVVVRNRIRYLEDLKIIIGYRLELNLAEIGMTFFKLQLHLKNYDIRAEEELLEYCKTNPHIILFVQQIGDCNVELEFEVSDYNQFNHYVDEIRERFSKYIRRVDAIMIRKETYKWMPVDIIQN